MMAAFTAPAVLATVTGESRVSCHHPNHVKKYRFPMKVSSCAIEGAFIASRKHFHCPTKVSS